MQLFGFFLYYPHSCLKVRQCDIREKTALKTASYTVVKRFYFSRRTVEGHDYLLVVLIKGIEGVEEFLLCLLLAGNKLNVVYEQYVHPSVLAAEIVYRAESELTVLKRLYKLVGEILAPDVLDFFIREIFFHLILYCKQQMSFSDSGRSVYNKRVVCDRVVVGHRERRRVGKAVCGADHEI